MSLHGLTAKNAAAVAAQESTHDGLDDWSQHVGGFMENNAHVSFYFHG